MKIEKQKNDNLGNKDKDFFSAASEIPLHIAVNDLAEIVQYTVCITITLHIAHSTIPYIRLN